MKYRVTSKRWDDDAKTEEFEENSDGKALEKFDEKWVKNSQFDWDHLMIHRIDVVEKTTFLKSR